MGFPDWKRRSKQFTDLYGRFDGAHLSAVEAACKAAFMAGYRDGRKDAEEIAKKAIELREILK